MKLESNHSKGRDEASLTVKHHLDSAAVLRILCRYGDTYASLLPRVNETTAEIVDGQRVKKGELEDLLRTALQAHGDTAYAAQPDWAQDHSPVAAHEIARWAVQQVRRVYPKFDDDLLAGFADAYQAVEQPAVEQPAVEQPADGEGASVTPLAGRASRAKR